MNSLRALFCFSANYEERIILLDKRFPTVERRAKKVAERMEASGKYHEHEDDFALPHLPAEYSFVSLPFDQKFILNTTIFPVPQATSPVGQIPPGNFLSVTNPSDLYKLLKKLGITSPIWPVVHITRKEVVYAAIPLLDEDFFHNGSKPQLIDCLTISSTLSFLENLSRTVSLIKAKSGSEFTWEEVDAAVGAMMPFGTIIDCHPERSWNLLKGGFAPRQTSSLPKRPAWKPFAHKGRQTMTVIVQQTIETQIQLQGDGENQTKDRESEYSILCSIIIEALLAGDPEITLSLKSKAKQYIENECMSPYVSEYSLGEERKKFVFRAPLEPIILYSYTIPFLGNPLPITGSYHMKQVSATQIKILLQIKFNMKLTSCVISLPFPNRGKISSIDATPTNGKCSTNQSRDALTWKFGTKELTSKNTMGAVALPGFITFKSAHGFNEELNPKKEDRFIVGENNFAEVFFEVEDFDLADWDFEFKSSPSIKQLAMAPTKKTLTARSYKIWNSLGQTTIIMGGK